MAKYNEDGERLTDCCGAMSTYCDGVLVCKACYNEVPIGQGDGTETRPRKACVSCGKRPRTVGTECDQCREWRARTNKAIAKAAK